MKKCRVCNTYLDDETAFCTECGGVFDADINNVKELLAHLGDHIDPKDFRVSGINISLEGICPNCKGHNN